MNDKKNIIYYNNIKYTINPKIPQVKNLKQKGNIYLGMLSNFKDILLLENELHNKKGNWHLIFNNNNPIYIDIGCGHGDLLSHLSINNPNINYIGIDIKFKPLVLTASKISKYNLTNALVLRYHAQLLNEIFDKEEISGAFIYFPSPWIKKKHKKNRFFNPIFIENFAQILKPNSSVEIKTDSLDYFNQIVDILSKSDKFHIVEQSQNYWNSTLHKPNEFKTLFEKFAIRDNLPIFYVKIQKK